MLQTSDDPFPVSVFQGPQLGTWGTRNDGTGLRLALDLAASPRVGRLQFNLTPSDPSVTPGPSGSVHGVWYAVFERDRT